MFTHHVDVFLAILLFLHATDGCTSSWKFAISLRLTSPSRLCKASLDILVILHAIAFSGFLAILLFLHAPKVFQEDKAYKAPSKAF